MKVFITCNAIQGFTGSELVVVDLAIEFKRRGWDVTVGAQHYGALRKLLSLADVKTVALKDGYPEGPFDLAWFHHNNTLGRVAAWPACKKIYSSLSPVTTLERPPKGLKCIDLFLANSLETVDALTKSGHNPIHLFPNPASREFIHFPSRQREKLTSVAIVSNHISPETALALKALAGRGIKTAVYGDSGQRVLVTPQLLDGHDAIITIGRTVQAALVMGIPVYCYDQFGGPGYITPVNMLSAAQYNYAGRCCRTKKTAEVILLEMVTGFKSALEGMKVVTPFARERYDLKKNVDDVLQLVGL